MRMTAIVILTLAMTAPTVAAVDFLGVELCKGSTDTAVDLPIGSSLILESVEIGDHGGLVMLLSARSGKVMEHVDNLMTGLTGQRGAGDTDSLEWTDGRLTGVAQRVAKKYAALAVASSDECPGTDPSTVVAAPAATSEPSPAPDTHSTIDPPAPAPVPVPAAAAAVVAAAASARNVPPPPAPEPAAVALPDFEVVGAISHQAADQTWVDVMGVVANHTENGYKLATFDLSFFDADGDLICVDTISVSVLKTGQERAFRDSIRCPGYVTGEVEEIRLQFAGGF